MVTLIIIHWIIGEIVWSFPTVHLPDFTAHPAHHIRSSAMLWLKYNRGHCLCVQATVAEKCHGIQARHISVNFRTSLGHLPPIHVSEQLSWSLNPFSCPLARRRDRALSEPALKTLCVLLRCSELPRLLGQPYKMFSVLGKPCSLPGSSGTGCPLSNTNLVRLLFCPVINCVPWVNDITGLCFNFFTGERVLFSRPLISKLSI